MIKSSKLIKKSINIQFNENNYYIKIKQKF